MPREAEPSDLGQTFPWEDWEAALLASPTKALVFDKDDFGAKAPYVFQRHAKKAFKHLDVSVRVRGEEVVVAVNA